MDKPIEIVPVAPDLMPVDALSLASTEWLRTIWAREREERARLATVKREAFQVALGSLEH